MSTQTAWPVPRWLDEMSDEERAKAQVSFYLRLAAIYASASGEMQVLAGILDMHPTAVSKAHNNSQVSPKMAIGIERLLGRNLFPRELLRPDLFVIEE